MKNIEYAPQDAPEAEKTSESRRKPGFFKKVALAGALTAAALGSKGGLEAHAATPDAGVGAEASESDHSAEENHTKYPNSRFLTKKMTCGYGDAMAYTLDEMKAANPNRIVVMPGDDFDPSSITEYCNVEDLSLIHSVGQISFDRVDGSKLSNVKHLTLELPDGNDSVTTDGYSFIEDMPSLEKLSIECPNGYVDTEVISKLGNIDVDIQTSYLGYVDYSKLTSLKSLHVSSSFGRTEIATTLSTKDIKMLRDAGVELSYDNPEEVDAINAQLDSIVDGLGIEDGDSELDRTNKVLQYVLENCNYDSTSPDGYSNFDSLTAALSDGDHVTPLSYASITSALLHRVGVKSRALMNANSRRVWNTVRIGDYDWYIDAASLDISSFKDKDGSLHPMTELLGQDSTKAFKFDTYLADPGSESTKEAGYVPSSILGYDVVDNPDAVDPRAGGEIVAQTTDDDRTPEHTQEVTYDTEAVVADATEAVPTTDGEQFADSKVEVSSNGKIFVISGAALVGILSALGAGYAISRKKKKKSRESFDWSDSYGGDSDGGWSSSSNSWSSSSSSDWSSSSDRWS